MIKLSWQKYVAEMIGAGMLTFMVLASLSAPTAVLTPLVAGLTLGLFVYTIGGISGSHINPAVTIGLWSVQKIKGQDAFAYVVFQLLGAIVASLLFKLAMGALPAVTAGASLGILFAEAAGAGVLLFGISAVVHGKTPDSASGLTIGGSLLLGIFLAGAAGANGVLNPAVAVGISSVSWAYILGPIVGAVISCWLYRWLAAK